MNLKAQILENTNNSQVICSIVLMCALLIVSNSIYNQNNKNKTRHNLIQLFYVVWRLRL